MSSSSSGNGRIVAGCISRILRSILCLDNPRSSPFDGVKDEEKEALLEGEPGTGPGIVARLMGLDSVPRAGLVDGSRSTNYDDSCVKSRSKSSPLRRRRIIPSYQELQDDNFFILSFENECQSNYDKKKKKKRKKIRRESLHGSDKENQGDHIFSRRNSDNCDSHVKSSRKVPSPLKSSDQNYERLGKKKVIEDGVTAIKIESRDSSENSSPNSVLDFVEFPAASETACSGDMSRLANSKFRRTLSEEIENCRKARDKELMIKAESCNEEEKQYSLLRNRINKNCRAEKWDEIVKLAAEEMVKSGWLQDETSRNENHFKEIARDVASEILDQLISELLIFNFG